MKYGALPGARQADWLESLLQEQAVTRDAQQQLEMALQALLQDFPTKFF
jgi:hypothetical protein